MKLTDFAKLLQSSGLPCRYRSFPRGSNPKPPYAIYYQSDEQYLNADNHSYHTVKAVTVELITKNKDEVSEEKLKSLFDENKLFFEFVDELEIETEGLYQVIYEVNLL